MKNSLWKRSILAIAILAWGLAVSSGLAQVITTSALNGSVFGDKGQPLAGAQVTVTYEPTGTTYATTSRPDGSFAVRGLRPGGPYTVVATAPGAGRGELTGLELAIDRDTEITVRLQAEQVVRLDRFVVSASAADRLFDTSQMGAVTALTRELIELLPTGDRSINSLARLDPRMNFVRDPTERGVSVSGLSNRYNAIQVDGVSASDPFGLNGNNTAAERNVVPMDSLEALTVNTSPYNARHAGFVGAQVNAITKSGGNQFKGSAYYTYRDQSLVGEKLDGKEYPLTNFKEQTWGATLGGPLLPRRLFFCLSWEKVDEDRVAPTPAARVPGATIQQIVTAAQALGFQPGSAEPPTANKLKDQNALVKIDWEINPQHRATARYNTSRSSRPTFPNFGTGVAENNFSFDSMWYQQEIRNTSYIGQLISRWSDRLNTELSVSRSKYHSEPKNASRQPQVEIRNVPVPGSSNTAYVYFGTERSRHSNVLDVVTDSAELFGTFQWSPRHTLQAGLQYDTSDISNLFVQDSLGNYSFNNLDEFLTRARTGGYRQYLYNRIVPGVEAAALFGEANAGLFVNDLWRPRSNLSLTLGVRCDMPLFDTPVPLNSTFVATFGRRNDYTYDGQTILQPRFGFNWQPALAERTIVRGGFGLFYGRMPRVWMSNSYSNTGANYQAYQATTTATTPPVSASPDTQPTAGSSPALNVAFVDPGFELPSRWKGNLAFERELGAFGLKFTAEAEATWVARDVLYRNLNLVSTRTAADGRQLFFNTYAATSSGTRLFSTAFTNRTIELTNTGKGGTRVWSFSLERPRRKDGWAWRAAYVSTRAREVLFATSSVAASNWQSRSILNPGEDVAHRGEIEIPNKVLVNVSKEFTLVKGCRTTLSLLYDGRSGFPFSFVYTNDANGDSVTQNDLLYVPLRSGDPLVRFATTADRDRFFQIVDRFGLTPGAVVPAAGQQYPWVNQFDFSVKQEIRLPGWRHRVVLGADLLNVGNLLNDKWGLIRGSNGFFVKREGVASAAYDGVNNQYVYSNVSQSLVNNAFNPPLGRGEPAATRWSLLLTARYLF